MAARGGDKGFGLVGVDLFLRKVNDRNLVLGPSRLAIFFFLGLVVGRKEWRAAKSCAPERVKGPGR